MAYIVLYWGAMALGYFTGSRQRHNSGKFRFLSALMLVCIALLVFLMGIRMGSNEEVIQNLGNIGVQALIITVVLMTVTVLGVTLTRKILGMDKFGLLPKERDMHTASVDSAEEEKEETKTSHTMTWVIVIFVAIGLLAGYFFVRVNVDDLDHFNEIIGGIMTAGITLLLGAVGLDMGLSGTVARHLKTIGFRVVAFPIAVIVSTVAAGVVLGLCFESLTVRESLAICFGFGWYTFAPVTITNAGHVIAGAVSFMHNVFRELSGIILIPVLARKIGFIEVTSLPGVAAMDICIPIVEKVTRADIIVYSFAVGMVEGLLVPLLVPVFIGA